jgi:signal transduction histidine kinase/ActR/RegA family two-component response regulator
LFVEKVAYLYSHPTEVSRDLLETVDGTVLDRYSAPVRDAHGKYYGRIWAFRDITEQRRLEGQLRHSQKMEAIGQLSGGIAHDFNNLLTAILGHLGLMQLNSRLPPEVTESLGEITAAANRAANLTRQLLAFSRLQVISASALDLNEVVTNLTKMLRRILGEHITVQMDYAPEQLTFHGDAGMMEQVLVNLAVNARDAMPGGGTLRITTGSETRVPPATEVPGGPAEPKAVVRLSVHDTGVGIDPLIRGKIFDPFFTTKDVGKGTGLGLATVFGIVQQHAGWIEVESEVGRGSTFHLYLPRLAAVPAVRTPEPPMAPARGRAEEVILLVEDEISVREVGLLALRRQGYRVLPAVHGREALAVWAKHKDEITLLLTDMIMPGGITGRQLALQLLAEKPALKVVYTSGYSADIAGKELTPQERANYLAKPFEIGELLSTVRRALDGVPG